MARRATAKRYAEAIFRLAGERREWDQWQKDLATLASLSQEAELVALLENPRIPFERKRQLLGQVAAGVEPLALNLASLLVAKGRLAMMGEIAAEYERLLDAQRGIERAQVVTAIPLEEAEKEELSRRLAQATGRKIRLETEVSSSLIGGLVVRLGDQLLDGSLRARLQTLKKSLLEAKT